MKHDALKSAEKFSKVHKRKRQWNRVVTGLACVVVFCTVYALILPAITMECKLPEHVHSMACYTQVTSVTQSEPVCTIENLELHQHQNSCYDSDGNLICGYADFVVHQHDSSCYDENGNLWCPLPEIYTHKHNESCFAVISAEPHVHTDACYTVERGELVCSESTEPAHVHTDDCYTETSALVCTEEHEHGESCYETVRELTCGCTEEPAHQHSDQCYEQIKTLICDLSTEPAEDNGVQMLVCDRNEVILHEHTSDCFDNAGNLICGKIQVLEHQHTDACFTEVTVPVDTEALTCTLPEDENHTHTALCYGIWELTCGMEEHTHDEECSGDSEEDAEEETDADIDLNADVETQDQWEQTFTDLKLTGEWRQDVITIAKTQLGYTESTSNYIVLEDGSHRGYTRYGDWYGIPYGDWCAMFVSFCLNYAEIPREVIPYEANCQWWIEALEKEKYNLYRKAEDYTPVSGDLIFYDWEQDGVSDHVGLVVERIPASEETPERLIAIEGNSSDQVRLVTYDLNDPAIKGYGQLPEQTFYCGKLGHVHSSDCGGEDVCQLEEHIHTDSCKMPVVEDLTELTFEGADYTVTVRYGADAELPEGVELVVAEIPQDTQEYQAYYAQAAAAMDTEETEQTVVFARFFDISFQIDGVEYEPAAPVLVTITYAQSVETDENSNYQTVHFSEDGTEILNVTVEQQEDGSTSFTHNQDGFSVVGTLVTAAYGINDTDVGPAVLPVDYYVHIDGQWVCVGSTKTGWYGDYTTTKWENTNRDCITVDQAYSILGPYGFKPDAPNAALQFAYQRKETHLEPKLHCDTSSYTDPSKSSSVLLPLARNQNPRSGYNIYFLPGNKNNDLSTKLETVPTTGSDFYTVSIYDAEGKLLKKSDPILTGGEFTWTVTDTDSTDTWLAAYGDGHTELVSVTDGSLTLTDITSTVHVSPAKGEVNKQSVTFKVLVDGQWKTVGSLPYYYTSDNTAYITSDMAAQFFGDYGYTAGTDPGYHFAYSYNDLYQIVYCDQDSKAPTNFCMDVAGAKYIEGTAIQLYKINNSDAQLFRIRDAEAVGHEGYHYITPYKNSGLQVNLSGEGEVNSQKLVLWNSPTIHSSWKVISETNGTVSFQLKENPSFYIDVNSNTQDNSVQLQIYQNAGAKFWKLNQQYKISSSKNTDNSDGTWNIGSALETNGDIVCYYMPVAASGTMTNLSEAAAAEMSGGSWYSVTVVDDTHAVYSDLQLQELSRNVESGTPVTIIVDNADGILWSCRGLGDTPLEVTTTQSGGKTTFDIKAVDQPVEIVATQANPDFSVQYYCNIPRYATSGGSATLTVIDTTGKSLPQNGITPKTKTLQLEDTGRLTNQNAGNQTTLYRVKTITELTKMYSEEEFQFSSSPDLSYFNKLKDNESYSLKEIWVLKDGKKSDSMIRDDWIIYTYSSDTAFTNEAGQAVGNTILINDGDVLRLVSDTNTGSYHNGTTFYDYNISSGKNDNGRWATGITGINSPENYGTSNNGQRNWTNATTDGRDLIAVGNRNTGTGLGEYVWGSGNYYPNCNNSANIGGCIFQLVTGLNADGTIRYDDWLIAPKLFNEGDAIGKQTYSGSSLTFDRVGDTYTLSSASLNGGGTISGLQNFFNPSPSTSTTHTHIFTNNFWPMDQAPNRTDPLFGKDTSVRYDGFKVWKTWNNYTTQENYYLPVSDDGNNHNSFFGMNFAISFNLTADYEGPLEYYFFGDDDLWVFLDNTLVCDIGGVHSSIGEYVNLRDYLPVGSEGQHTLTFFYTERGASGSTCYMSFTLPSVSSATTSRDTGSLEIAKSVSDPANGDFSNEEYGFKVELLTSENGTALNQTFSYKLSNNTYGTVKSGGTIKLKAGQTAIISGVPAGTFYRVTEAEESRRGYSTTVNNSQGYIVSGKIESGAVKPASFVNTPYCELPETGGAGSKPYTIGGILLITGAAFLLLYNHSKRRKEGSVSS